MAAYAIGSSVQPDQELSMPHFAYIDPGAGSLVIQALIAAFVSIPFFFRSAIRSAVQRLRRPPIPTEGNTDAVPDSD
jgi:hypothetical protein